MRSWTLYRYLLLALALSIPASSPAAVRNRITSAVQESNRVALSHTVAPRAMRAADLGAAPSSLPLADLAMHFSMTDAQQAALSQLLADQQDSSSPRFRQWLTPEQFGAQFGLSAADLAKVSSWLTAQGFTVTGVAKSSTFITFSGTAAQVQHAFGTTVHSVSLDGERHIANLTEPVLPAAIAGVVQEISGLNDFRLKPRLHKRTIRANSVHPQNTINTSTGLNHYIAPGDFYTIYGIPDPQSGSNLNGSGITIAVMGQVDLNTDALADVAAFRAASGLSANAPSIQTYGSDPGSPTGSCAGSNAPSTCTVTADDVDESLLDVEWAGAAAPSAKILFVTSTNVIGTSLVAAIDDNLAPIMTVSYGNCEANFSSASVTALNQVFQQANAQGITLFGPAGDDGATDCDFGATSATHGLAVDFPASSPYVTGVGGTTFNEGSGTYWNSANGAYGGSAISYIPEAVWNETALDLTSSSPSFGATGGGASILFPKPAWQTGTGVPNDSARDVPDVSLNAAANHDGYLVCAFSSCSANTFISTSGTFSVFGGTSAATPAFAGVIALVEQKLGGARIGNANPYLYALANSASYNNIFHDVQSGNNNSPCTTGTKNCPSGTTSIGFTAGPGYDQATGWGSVDANQLANAFSSVATSLKSTATMTVTFSPTNPALGVDTTFTVTLAPSSGGPVPTGTVSFSADGGTATSQAVNASGVATFTTNFSSNGTHSVYAYYSGDGSYYTSGKITPVIAGTIPTGHISLSASPAAITVANAGTITTTVTITSTDVYAGTVNLTATADGLSGSYSFLPVSSSPTCTASGSAITLAVGGSGTCTFTVTSVAPANKGTGGLKQGSAISSLILGGGITVAGLLFFGGTDTRRKGWPTLFSLLAITALITSAGCGKSTSTPAGTGGGTYAVTLTGTDSVTSAITASTTLSVTIK